MVAVLALQRGVAAVKPTRAQLGGAALVGLLLPGANAVVSVAEQEVPSSIAALLIASVPLWVILLRAGTGDRVSLRGAASVLVGFAGVALLVRPGEQSGDATVLGLLACVGAALMWASGSFASPRLSLPRDPLASVGWQMLLGGIAITVVGLALGEGGDVDVDAFSTRSLLALAYLIVFGSWVAYTAYAWLLQNAPISKVSTYAYVNPVVAIFARLADPRRGRDEHDDRRRDDHRRLGRARRADRVARAAGNVPRVSLTAGSGPLGERPAGRFDRPVPERVLFIEGVPAADPRRRRGRDRRRQPERDAPARDGPPARLPLPRRRGPDRPAGGDRRARAERAAASWPGTR